jgi:hypothetical protein
VLVLAAAVGSAAGNRLELNATSFRFVWSPLRFDIAEGLAEMRCQVTLEGSFHSRTFVKSAGTLVGYVTRAAVGSRGVCEGGTATVLSATLPWHVRYQSFEGTLPRIRGVELRIIGVAWRIEVFGLSCLYRTGATQPAGVTAKLGEALEWSPTITSVRANEALSIQTDDLLCESADMRISGSGRVTQQGSASALTLRLI